MDEALSAWATLLDASLVTARIAERVWALFPRADGAGIGLCVAEGQLLFPSARGVCASLTGRTVPVAQTFHEQAMRSTTPVSIRDAAANPRLPPRTATMATALGVRSWMVAPLHHHGTTIGALSVTATAAQAFTDDDVVALASVSTVVSAMIASNIEMRDAVEEVVNNPEGPGHHLARQFLAEMLVPDGSTRSAGLPTMLGSGGSAHAIGLGQQLDSLLSHDDAIDAVYQPMVDLRTRRVLAFEGLCRFPRHHHMNTAQWFDAARTLGRSRSLEVRALAAIIDGARALPGHHHLAVNLSPLVALDPEVHEVLTSSTRQLIVELTEHEPFPHYLDNGLRSLREHGVLLAIDDAGAGYASFTQLLRLRPDIIKLDGEFTTNIEHDPAKRAVITALAQLAEHMSAVIVAEAIQTPEQLRILTDLNVTWGQGHLLGHPLPATHYAALIDD